MTDDQLHLHCLQWADWCATRRYFAPPVPENILAQFQVRRRAAHEPDGQLSPLMPFFNMAVHGLAEEEPEDAICFTLFYFYGFRPVKAMAAALGIGRQTFYDRMHRFAKKAIKLAPKVRQIHEEMCTGFPVQNRPVQIAAF